MIKLNLTIGDNDSILVRVEDILRVEPDLDEDCTKLYLDDTRFGRPVEAKLHCVNESVDEIYEMIKDRIKNV